MIILSGELRQGYDEQGSNCCIYSLASGFFSVMVRFLVLVTMAA